MSYNAEAKIQASIVEWIKLVAPDVLVFHVPNGGLRSKREAALLKWTGTLAGIPDLVVIASPGNAYFLEVKTPDGRVSPAQRDLMLILNGLGARTAVVRSVDDAKLAFDAWGIKTREAA